MKPAELIGKRCLIRKNYSKKEAGVFEAQISEISKSGDWVKIKRTPVLSEWVDANTLYFEEVLN